MTNREGFSLTIFLPEGYDGGLRKIEKSEWHGCGIQFSRSQYISVRNKRSELEWPGVYILLGSDLETGIPDVYIGEGDPLKQRLEDHYKNKEFWTEAIFFVSPNGRLNKAHVQYLECRLVTACFQK